jgi:hypothetical protein
VTVAVRQGSFTDRWPARVSAVNVEVQGSRCATNAEGSLM